MKLKKLYKRASDGIRVNGWEVEIENNKYRTISGFEGMKQTTSEWTSCNKKSYCTADEQALKEANALHDKKKRLGYFENINECDNIEFFEPMLAAKYEDYKDKIVYPIYSQPKLDGIRCIVRKDGMWSRNGKKIISAPHIFESLQPLFDTNPTLVFDGEMYADKFANDFNAICSLVKKTKPTQEDLDESALKIEYHIYDLPSCDKVFDERLKELNLLNLPKCCILVPTYVVFNEQDVIQKYESYMEQGYEGQMLRLNSKYENKRSKSLLKYKEFTDEEYIILGVEEGIGNKKGMVGSFVFQNKNGKTFNSSPKFNWEECIKMWNDRENLIGKSATVKYFNLTPDGIPRFPYVIKIDRESYE